MLMLGKANWWLPRSLDRLLPHLNVEGDVTDDPAPAPEPAEPPRDLIPAPSAA
jgi:RND superfamily putative drug exporter